MLCNVIRWCFFLGSCVWLFVVIFLKFSVFIIYSIVGVIVGFVLVVYGVKGINWMKMGFIGKLKDLNKFIISKKG